MAMSDPAAMSSPAMMSEHLAMRRPEWRKSSRSGASGNNCVEVAAYPDLVLVRDSKAPDGPVLRFSTPAFQTFLRDAGHGTLHHR